MTGTSILAGMRRICTSLYPIEIVRNSSYRYSNPINVRIFRQNGDEFEQYPQTKVYMSSLLM